MTPECETGVKLLLHHSENWKTYLAVEYPCVVPLVTSGAEASAHQGKVLAKLSKKLIFSVLPLSGQTWREAGIGWGLPLAHSHPEDGTSQTAEEVMSSQASLTQQKLLALSSLQE